jgi:predicted nucleic acid-binding protein
MSGRARGADRPFRWDSDAPPPLVVDAALAVKWVLPEELSGRAEELLVAAVSAGRAVVGSPVLALEVADAVHVRARREEITNAEADVALSLIPRLGLVAADPPQLLSEAVAFARAHRLKHLHDAHHAVLARLLDTELWTADRTLHKNLGPIAPWVRWVGDFAG